MNKEIIVIAAIDDNLGISKNGKIPWHNSEDLKHFKSLTMGNTVVCGKNTYLSLPKPRLPGRKIIVVSSTLKEIDEDETIIVDSIDTALVLSNSDVYIIGGSNIYKEIIASRLFTRLVLTRIAGDYKCDKFFPKIDKNNLTIINSVNSVNHKLNIEFYSNPYRNQEIGEINYRNLLKDIIREGEHKQTRNGITLSIFQRTLTFDLRNGQIPAINSKRVGVKSAFTELIWILNGSKNAKDLAAKGVKVWDANTSLDFLQKNSRLVNPKQGEMGETYGFVMRHYGAQYQGLDSDYTGQGYDQLAMVIDQIKNNPANRRMIINLFKPDAQSNCSLPPCVMMYHFNVNIERHELNCMVYIRSSDTPVGLPWNFLTGAYMLCLLAHLTGYKRGQLSFVLGDAHIYQENLPQVYEMLERDITNMKFPSLEISKSLNNLQDLLSMTKDDISVKNYKPHSSIKMTMQE